MVKSKTSEKPLTLFWFRRDLRLEDNAGLAAACEFSDQVQPLFIFDRAILDRLEDKDDPRVTFIFDQLAAMKERLVAAGSDLWVFYGEVMDVFGTILQDHRVEAVMANGDYEPYARRRDEAVSKILEENGIQFRTFKDQVIFEKEEILTGQLKTYTVFTPYKKKWLEVLSGMELPVYKIQKDRLARRGDQAAGSAMPSLSVMGFARSEIQIPPIKIKSDIILNYDKTRDFPFHQQGTSRLGIHFRFGTFSPREAVRQAKKLNSTFLSELIWREFFMQILWNYPHVEKESFRQIYDKIAWRKSREDFRRWKNGETGYPLVDAGMRELAATNHMHNRVRMVVASFLCKHLLIHWYEGERYFAQKLLDYDLSANNGNWQWAAGTGCDAAPYFRVFNPEAQLKKFDPDGIYVSKWVPEWKTAKYPAPMVVHEEARARALMEYKKVLKGE